MRRSLVALGFLLSGAAAGLAFWRSRSGERRPHVDVYFEDGSMVSFGPGTPAGGRLLPLAGDALSVARGG